MFHGKDDKGNKVKSGRRIDAVHLTSDTEMQARKEEKVDKDRKEKEKRNKADASLEKKKERLKWQ